MPANFNQSVINIVLQVLNASHNLQGRNIEPQRARARGAGGSSRDGGRKLFVAGVDEDIPESGIRSHFESFGPVSSLDYHS